MDTEYEVPQVAGATLEHTPGWVSEDDRNGFWSSPFYKSWDEWDQITLRKSVATLKKQFRVHYRGREWGDSDEERDNIVKNWTLQLRERFKGSPADAFLPWWKKNRIRSNPFNADGKLCKKKD